MSVAISIQHLAHLTVVLPETAAPAHLTIVGRAPSKVDRARTRSRRVDSEEIRARVFAQLERGAAPDLNQMARAMDLSNRTLQRILATSGTTFSLLLDEARYCRARQMLAARTYKIEDIGRRLGFADSVAFRRAFRRWTGLTPGAFRKACPLPFSEALAADTHLAAQ